jgi:hypothetical protein
MTIRRKLIPLETATVTHENARRLDWSNRRALQI